ncbi:FAD-dependent monooxygenase [Paraburkholderia sp. USG1]|uniref:FAD-dependent monooxygenase n=1 Tax=Paraburkholderia sp. USG1 TaxID=2952268 RepID=UPI002863FDEE|nr:FAD-dependent monooxygenase [Paraburkholderia sp. USG1]MDR8398311.1 FAD-dependent monooxygenase [Paraburkholderia sp. USG1]
MKHDIRILVSGASVAGLSTAYWLARYGFQVTVVERAPHLRPGGQALDVRGPALEVAERMGILATLRERATRLTGMSVVDAGGQELFRSTERTLTGGRFDSPDVEILRDDLCQVLYKAVEEHVAFLFDDRITSITQDESGVDVAFARAAPRRFDLVIGADGLHSGVRRLVFGPEEPFLRFVGFHVAVFAAPNFLGLDHWQVFHDQGNLMAGVLAMDRDAPARVYLGFGSAEALDYDYRDIAAQKRLVTERFAGAAWEIPQLLAHMQDAPDFYFDATHQVRMDSWSSARVVLVGDAGYSVSPATGQGTTVAMVGAYVLAGELAACPSALVAGIGHYEHALRDYIARNQDLAIDMMAQDTSLGQSEDADSATHPDGVPDFGQMVQPFRLKPYPEPVQ